MHRLTDREKEEIKRLWESGKMDTEISKELGIKVQTVAYYRNTHDMPTKFTYDKVSKIHKEEFEELFNRGLSDYKIAKILGVSSDGIYSYRMRNGYVRKDLRVNPGISLTEYQKEVLIGTLLGDSCLRCTNRNPYMVCEHGYKQRDYCLHKYSIFKSLGSIYRESERRTADKRTGICYKSSILLLPANPEFAPFYSLFYKDGKKIIPVDLLNSITPVSLAFWFMDDGYKMSKSYALATNCFSTEELNHLRIFLFDKFRIETSLLKRNILYIRSKSRDLFTSLISPYIIDSMKYKLQSLNSVNLEKP